MQNERSKFKEDFKRRLYSFTLKLIEFLDLQRPDLER